MPIVHISIAEGRRSEQIRGLIRAVTESTSTALDAPIDTVRVVVTEVPTSHWGSGSQTLEEKRAPADSPPPSTSKPA